MLALVESCFMGNLLDRPDLGCSMLISACQERGIKTTLIKGQTRYLKDMFLNDSEELWDLIQDLRESDLKKIGIGKYKKAIQRKGPKQFQVELESLYRCVIIDKNPRNYFNGQMAEEFNNLHSIFAAIYFYYLRKLNHRNLKIVDRYVSEILSSNPSYIGFSLRDSFEPFSRIIRKRIKELTEIPIIIGGSLTPFIDLKIADKTFKKEHFDYLIIGAGERALPSLIETLNNKKEPKGIANVFYKKDGKLRGNNLEIIQDLDSLPYPDYSQFDLDLYLTPKRILPIQTARGCNWRKCVFCSHHNIDLGNYKTFSIKRVIETIKYLHNTYSCSHFAFHDEGLPPARAKGISEAILRNGFKSIYINTYARPVDGYNNTNLLCLMRKAGFTLIHWGIESGSQRILDLMNKGIKISTVRQILRKSSKSKIANLCFVFFGFPGETKEEVQQTVQFLKSCADNIEEILIQFFFLNPNSPMGKNPKKWGVEVKKNGSYLTKTGMSPKQGRAFFSKFITELKVNTVKVRSDKLKYFLPGHNRRMLHFLNSNYELLPNAILLKYFIRGRLNNIFPIILGDIKKKDDKMILCPVNIKETTFINKHRPEKERVLNSLEEKIFILSNGTLSIENIVSVVCRDFKNEHGDKYIRKRCKDFFREIFIKNLALGFAKSWQLS